MIELGDNMLVNFKEMLNKAKKEHFAVPHFNINDLEWTKYILEECQKLDVPVILGVSDGAAKYMGGYDVIYGMVTGLIKDLNITIPVCLHVDHGCTETCKKAIDAGFTSVMIDASKYELSENIKMTKEIVDYAHPKGVSVEAEVGHIGGTEDKMYVVGKDIEKNILYIALGEDNEYLKSDSCLLEKVNSLGEKITKCTAKFRYRQQDVPVELEWLDNGEVIVNYPKGVKSVTPGQACVFYNGDECLGGGIIKEVRKNNKKLWYL